MRRRHHRVRGPASARLCTGIVTNRRPLGALAPSEVPDGPRRELPRKISLSDYNDADIRDIVWALNSTPRKCLAFQTPIEAFAHQLGVAIEM